MNARAASSGSSIHIPYLTVGAGPPLVVFPGLSRVPVKSGLPYRGLAHITHRCIYVINRPPGLQRGLTMPDLAGQHAKILAELFDQPVDLLGASTGGVIALQLAVDHPHLVNRLIVTAAASWLGDQGRLKLKNYGDEVFHGRGGAKILASVLAAPSMRWLVQPSIWLAHQFERRTNPNDMLATIDAEVGFDVTSQLGQIRARTLLIAGGRDRAFPLPLMESTARQIPDCRLIVYPRAGHIGTMLNSRFGHDVATFLNDPEHETASQFAKSPEH